jgi:hypothetical protein
LLRIGYGEPGRPTPRRDVDDVIVAVRGDHRPVAQPVSARP